MEVKAADTEFQPVMEMSSGRAGTIDTVMAAASTSTQPVCEHKDPYYGLYPHSTMRYIRTVMWYNEIESRTDKRDWYQCVLCGYECFWVHNE